MPVLLEILTGPDQGKTFPLESELLHIGRGADNSIVLTDPELGDFHASVSQQQGRLSLYANEANQIRVGEASIPGQQWVSVPADVIIHLGGQTEVRVTDSLGVTLPTPPRSAAPGDPVSERRRPPRKESKRQVARPIIGRTGDAVIQWGADGKFPELALVAGTSSNPESHKPRSTNPALLFTILAASCLSSAGLLLVDFETSTVVSSADQAFTRSKLAAYYGTDSTQLEPYQKLLRQASIEHSQGNHFAERKLLKHVLSLLNSVDAAAPDNLNGLTGRQTGRGKASDKELQGLLQQALN